MNPCMKTGFNFAMHGREQVVLTGDLFLLPNGVLQIRGIPADKQPDGTYTPFACQRFATHAIIAPITLTHEYSHYMQTAEPVKITWCSQFFRDHVHEWSPDMAAHLPPQEQTT